VALNALISSASALKLIEPTNRNKTDFGKCEKMKLEEITVKPYHEVRCGKRKRKRSKEKGGETSGMRRPKIE